MIRQAAALAASVALLAGCASTSARPAFDEVATTVKARSGHAVRWDPSTDEDRRVEEAIDALLRRELTADAAVEVALLGSPRLRAKLEELAIAQADLVQAGLLKNPVFSFGRTAWESEHITPNLFATVEQDFLDVLTMPMRKRVAATELEATKLEVADHVLELAAEVREAFYAAQAAEQVVAMRRLVAEAAKASAELATRQHEAGNMSDLALSTELGLTAQTTLDLRRAEGEAAVLREKLNKAMGTWGPRTGWKLGAKLPELPEHEPPLERLESAAIAQRLDVGAARRNVQGLGYALSLAKTTRWTGTVSVAVEAGRLRHNKRISFGPSVALEIPLFDRREAQVAKLEAYARQAEHELHALAIDVRADVRSSRARVLTARGVVEEYGSVVVPLREKVVRFSQEQYDAMLLGVYQLIQAKQSEFEAYREYIEALRDYWIARSDLERAVGGRLAAAASAAAPGSGTSTIAPPPASRPHGPPHAPRNP
ncbi:MAG: TolC family protein [Labilithrix sp.]|nr:TolC family protein [Labilithrix sp.]MCW5831862.1 TolC family protein [Labilithrix sp.]